MFPIVLFASIESLTQHDFVFTTGKGTPLDGCRLNQTVKRRLVSAGLPPLKFYCLRNSCATFLLVQGVAPRVVMDILGHSQIPNRSTPSGRKESPPSRLQQYE